MPHPVPWIRAAVAHVALVVLVAGAAVAAGARPALADEEEPEDAFFAGARVAMALPAGSAVDNIDFMVPVWIEAGYSFHGRFYLGADLIFGWVHPTTDGFIGGTNCGCSVHDLTIGVEAMYNPWPTHKLDPWVGIGFGYERLTVASAGLGAANSSGFQYMNFQLGLNIRLVKGVAVGPFFATSLGSYNSADAHDGFGAPLEGVTADSSIHAWFLLGIRGQVSE